MIVVYVGMRWLREVSMWTKKKGTGYGWHWQYQPFSRNFIVCTVPLI